MRHDARGSGLGTWVFATAEGAGWAEERGSATAGTRRGTRRDVLPADFVGRFDVVENAGGGRIRGRRCSGRSDGNTRFRDRLRGGCSARGVVEPSWSPVMHRPTTRPSSWRPRCSLGL